MYEIDLICGDCLQIMGELPDNFVDLVLTDPPFGELKVDKRIGCNYKNKNEFLVWLEKRNERVQKTYEK